MMPATNSSGRDAYDIWLRARSAVTGSRYPAKLDYTIEVDGIDGDRPATAHYRAAYDSDAGTIALFPISDETLAAPAPVPHGINVNILVFRIGHPEPYLDLLGEPLLSPTYSFGMRYASGGIAHVSQSGSLPVIATVSAQKPEYRVDLVDEPAIDGVPTYHLGMTPLRDPKNNRLRQLWVGESDYLPRRAEISGNFEQAPMVDVPWTVDFSVVDGAAYIEREIAGETLRLPHRRVVRDATISFENVREPTSIYDEPLLTPALKDGTLTEP